MQSKTLLSALIGAVYAFGSLTHADSLVAVTLSDGSIDEYYVAKGSFNASATWSRVRTIATIAGVHGITYNPADGFFYATVVGTGTRKICKISRSGLVTDLALRGTSTPNWSASDPQGIEIGPDGKVYFSTAFTGEGIFSLATNGTGFARFIAPTVALGGAVALNNSARDLMWDGSNLYVSVRGNNAIHKFNSSGAFVSTLTTACTGASALGKDGTTLLVTTNQAAATALRKVDNYATSPLLGTLTTTGKINGLEIDVIEGQRHYLTFNSGTGGAGDINRLNADGSSTVMATFNTPTVRTANDFAVYTDVDSDTDGLPDGWEIAKFGNLSHGPSEDADTDGLTNLQEYTAGTNPVIADTDGDGVTDGTEVNRLVGITSTPTNPTLIDTDGDGLTDGQETNTGTYVSLADTGTNPLAADSDGDTFNDYVEIARSSNPSLNTSTPAASAPGPIVNLNASALSAGPLSNWSNGGTIGSNFILGAGVPNVQSILGVKGVTFTGTEVMTGPVAPPVLTGNSPRTITAWIYNPTTSTEETIFAWGRRGGGNGTNCSFLHGTSGTFGAVGHWGTPDMAWGATTGEISTNVKIGKWTYIAYTFNGSTASLYANGVAVSTNPKTIGALNTWAIDNTALARPLPFRIAGSNETDGSISSGGIKGSLTIARIQVYDRALTATELGNVDADSDGLPAWWENFYGLSDSNPADAALDSDGDTLTNLQEYTFGTNPNLTDTDGDGLSDAVETNTGSYVSASDTGTDPANADTDGDGLLDGVETVTNIFASTSNTGTNPLLNDTDGDGVKDGLEVLTYATDPNSDADKDSDTISDATEVLVYGSNPSLADTDGDTYDDGVELTAGSGLLDPISTPVNVNGFSGNLIHRFKLDETTGTTTADTLGPIVGTIGSDVVIGQSGRDGRSFRFPAAATVNSTVLMPASLVPLGTAPFTMSAWVRITAALTNGGQSHIISGNDGNAGRWNLGINDNDASATVDARLFWFHNGGVGSVSYAGFNFNDHINEWVHVAITRSSTGLTTLYLNGIGTDVGTSKATLGQGAGIALGARPNLNQFQLTGNIDDVRFYDGGLPPSALLAAYQAYPTAYQNWATSLGFDGTTGDGLPTADKDGDGTSNQVEFALGLDPFSATSRFAVVQTGTPTTGITLTWPSQPGISFRVKSSTDLTSFPTLEATVPGPASPATTATWTSGPLVGSKLFFRVEFTP